VTRPPARSGWSTFGATARGALHVRTGLPNQDAHEAAVTGSGGQVILAVADGHGDPRCVRADVGARLAVTAAADCSRSLLRSHVTVDARDLVSRFAGTLVADVVQTWRTAVDRHLSQQPWQPAELALLDPGGSHRLAYGCTLLLAVATGNAVVLVQIGDGDILLVRRDGATSRPVTQLTPLVGGETLSLAAADAVDCAAFRLIDIEDHLRLLILASDGYANSFEAADWEGPVGADYVRLLDEHGPAWMAASLPQWVQASAQAAGDDVTVLVGVRC